MATDTAQQMTELELLHFFLGKLLDGGNREMPVDEALAEFQHYRKEVESMREQIRPALEASLRGESKPFDVEDIIRRGRERFEKRKRSD